MLQTTSGNIPQWDEVLSILDTVGRTARSVHLFQPQTSACFYFTFKQLISRSVIDTKESDGIAHPLEKIAGLNIGACPIAPGKFNL